MVFQCPDQLNELVLSFSREPLIVRLYSRICRPGRIAAKPAVLRGKGIDLLGLVGRVLENGLDGALAVGGNLPRVGFPVVGLDGYMA